MNRVRLLRGILFVGSVFLFLQAVRYFFGLVSESAPDFGTFVIFFASFLVCLGAALLAFTFAWHASEYLRGRYGQFRIVALLLPVTIFLLSKRLLIEALFVDSEYLGFALGYVVLIELPVFVAGAWYLLHLVKEAHQQLESAPAEAPSFAVPATDAVAVAAPVAQSSSQSPDPYRYWKMASTTAIVFTFLAFISWPWTLVLFALMYGGEPADNGLIPESLVSFLVSTFPFFAVAMVVVFFVLRRRGWHKVALIAAAAPLVWYGLLYASPYINSAYTLSFDVHDNERYAEERARLLKTSIECPNDEFYSISDDRREIDMYKLEAKGRDIYANFTDFVRFYEDPVLFEQKLAYIGARCAGAREYQPYVEALQIPSEVKRILCVEPPDRKIIILSDRKVLMSAISEDGKVVQWPIGTLVGKEFRFNITSIEEEQAFTQCRVTTPNFSDTIYSVVRLNSFGAPL